MRGARLLFVAAHPDDETFRCGGTLALLARRGVVVQVLTATRGEAGAPARLSADESEQLALVRRQELCCACEALGIEPPLFLDYSDGALRSVPADQASSQVQAVLESFRPHVVLTWPPHGLSGHPDHVAVNRWTNLAFRRVSDRASDLAALYYVAIASSVAKALGYTHLHATPDDEITLSVDVRSTWDQKMVAIRCHGSQNAFSPVLNESAERQRLFLGQEHFARAVGLRDTDVLLELGKQQTG